MVANSVSAEWVVPAGVFTERVIFYLHGGAYNRGSINSHRTLVANIANAGQSRALIIDYRLAPNITSPAFT